MEAPILLKQFKKTMEQKMFQFRLDEHQLKITISSKAVLGKIGQICITQDAFPNNLKPLFQNIEDLYQFLKGQSGTENAFQCQNILMLTLLVQVRRRITKVNIHLVQKQISRQQLLERRVEELELMIKFLQKGDHMSKLKSSKIQSKEKYEQLLDQNKRLEAQIKKLSEEQKINKINSKSSQNSKQLENLTKKIDLLRDQNTKLIDQRKRYLNEISTINTKIIQLEANNKSQRLILDKYNQETQKLQLSLNNKSMILNYVKKDGPIANPEGNLLIFKPQQASVNYKYYSFEYNTLTKTTESGNGEPKLIPCDTALPQKGRHFYKMQLKLSCNPPNIRLGVIGRNPTTESFIYASDDTGVMYYCYNRGNEVIYSGQKRQEGFNLGVYDVLTVVIDMDKKKVEWYIEGLQQKITDFSKSLVDASQIYFFLQCYVNGDKIEMLNA